MIKARSWNGPWPARCAECARPLQDELLFFDARLPSASWGLLCPKCFKSLGCRLGIGQGQAFDAKTLEKIGG